MKRSRRRFLEFAASTAILPVVMRIAGARSYPARQVRVIVGFSPGGTQDPLARVIGQWLTSRLGQPFIIENRPGGGGNIGAEAVVRSSADGYTLLMVGPPNAINATLYDRLNYNFIRDIAPIASISREPSVMVVNPSVAAKTVPEFIAYAKANVGKVNMASSSVGSSSHIAGELFKMMTGVRMVHVPYRGGAPALIDLVGGQVQVMFPPMPASIEYIRTGKLRALAVTTATRSAAMPNLPTVGDFLPGYEMSGVYGVGAPRDTPAEIVDKLNGAINAALTDPVMKVRLATLGGIVLPGTPADFGKLIAEETEKWAKVIRAANIKV